MKPVYFLFCFLPFYFQIFPEEKPPRPKDNYARLSNCRFLNVPEDPYKLPEIKLIPVPDFPGKESIWGANGMDHRGHLWFGVTTTKGVSNAHLFEYDPVENKMTDRGSVVDKLKELKIAENVGQAKIHSRIIEGNDGYIYFSSFDEKGENEEKEIIPVYGGHMWRLKLSDHKWEHLFSSPDPLMAVNGYGRWMYALGYFGHILHQYDCKTGEHKKVRVGSLGGHVSRNFLCDHRGHVYVPRLVRGKECSIQVTLVELDTSLKEVGETPLENYMNQGAPPHKSHGIVGFQPMADKSIFFATHMGALYRVEPQKEYPSKISALGFYHPNGSRYVASMFTFSGTRYLLGRCPLDKKTSSV